MRFPALVLLAGGAVATAGLCPRAAGRLFGQLNLTYNPSLRAAADAWKSGDSDLACKLATEYYTSGSTGWWWRTPVTPEPSHKQAGGDADGNLHDEYCFYSVCATQPRDSSGELLWTWEGPNKDQEWKFALSRFPFASSMTPAWASTGNDAYSTYLRNSTLTWIWSQPVPASPSGANDTWRTIEAGIRASYSLPVGLFGLLNAPVTDTRHSAWVLELVSSAADHGNFLHQFYDEGNPNWRSMQLHGLAATASAFPELSGADAWFEKASSGAVQDFDSGVYPDGVETEETSAYHRVATDNFLGFVNVSTMGNRTPPATLRDGVASMVSYLALSMDGVGNNPLNSDADLQDEAEWLAPLAADYKNDTWRFMASLGAEGTAPEHMSQVWPWAGQVIMRAGDWFESDAACRRRDRCEGGASAHAAGSAWSWMDVGPFGSSSHAHYDRLQLTVRAYGAPLLVDSGRFSYSGPVAERFREPYARHSRGHNVVLLSDNDCEHPSSPTCSYANQRSGVAVATEPIAAGRDYAVAPYAEPPKGWVARANASVELDVSAGSGTHTRGVAMLPLPGSPASRSADPRAPGSEGPWMWVVADVIESSAPRAARWHWHAHPNATATAALTGGSPLALVSHDLGPGLAVVAAEGAGGVRWANASVVIGRLDPTPQGWYSPTYDVYGPSPAIQIDATVPAGRSFAAWVLAAKPSHWQGAPSAPNATITATDSGSVTVQVAYGGDSVAVRVPL